KKKKKIANKIREKDKTRENVVEVQECRLTQTIRPLIVSGPANTQASSSHPNHKYGTVHKASDSPPASIRPIHCPLSITAMMAASSSDRPRSPSSFSLSSTPAAPPGAEEEEEEAAHSSLTRLAAFCTLVPA